MNDNDQSTSSEGGSESHSTHYVRNLGPTNIAYYFSKMILKCDQKKSLNGCEVKM
jgi:hypothetical protein